MEQEVPVKVLVLELIYEITYLMMNSCLFHLMREIARAHTSTCATSLMRVRNSTRHFCL